MQKVRIETPERWKFSKDAFFLCYVTNLGTEVPEFQRWYYFDRIHHSQLCKWNKLSTYVFAELSPSVQ